MKKILAFLMMLSIAFSLASCNQANPSEKVEPNKEEVTPEKEENDNHPEENKNPLEEISVFAPYTWNDMETFLSDFEQDAAARDWYFLRFSFHDHSILEDYPTVKDSIIIPKLKSDTFALVRISAWEDCYVYCYLPTDVDPERRYSVTVHGGFLVMVDKSPESCSSWEEREGLEIFGDYAYDRSRADLYLNEDGQEVAIEYDEETLCLDSRAAIEEIITFERYGYNENGLYLIAEESL